MKKLTRLKHSQKHNHLGGKLSTIVEVQVGWDMIYRIDVVVKEPVSYVVHDIATGYTKLGNEKPNK